MNAVYYYRYGAFVKVLGTKSVIAGVLSLPLALGASPAHADTSAHGGQGKTRYAALGDSFASGVGAGDYIPASGDCYRSPRAYGPLWAAAHRPKAFQFIACSGATTTDVQQNQVPEVSRATTLVTLTVGGNDLGFSTAVAACLLPTSTDAVCDAALNYSEYILQNELPGNLRRTYQDVAAAAPKARVVLAGYPHLLETGTSACPYGTPERRIRINALTDQLDDLIRRTGKEQGFRFADVRRSFAGHGVCGPGEIPTWINALVTPSFASFHPTAVGQRRGYLSTVSAVVGESSGTGHPCAASAK
ncbi:SGNH/GDSL hydrolase family protein [Streptomyces actuosus]|uniref:SGNH/GDSL hydrolase family protein n=1 Tax=Streptomyces actuosus TaxID=1885 RepID=A0ABS2VYI6_STRAS|nr:SGNH/GDSL hydrolase family protein [Streptomyces actuosus]MBN0048202.1 SGNH/GDSL hydrolase family protein [Streptomyces actuosus]